MKTFYSQKSIGTSRSSKTNINSKYSNVTLFGKRETTRNSTINININNNNALSNNNIKFNTINNTIDRNNKPFKSKREMRNTKSQLPYFSTATSFNTINNDKDGKFLTGIELKFPSKKCRNLNTLSALSRKSHYETDNKNYSPKFRTIFSSKKNINEEKIFKNQRKRKSLNLLLEFEKNVENKNSDPDKFKKDKLLNSKISTFPRTSVGKFLSQTLSLRLLKFVSSAKRSRLEELREEKLGSGDTISEAMRGLLQARNLFEGAFASKAAEYVRFLVKRKETEKKENERLIKRILEMKNEMSGLMNKIKRFQLERNNLLQWVYFQIQLKEHKLELPKYYKLIIEEEYDRKTSRTNTIKSDKDMPSSRTLTQNKDYKKKLTRRLARDVTLGPDSKKKFDSYNIREKTTINLVHINPFSGFLSSNLPKNIAYNNPEFKGVTKDDLLRVHSYKNGLIFRTPEEMDEQFKLYEDSNLFLIESYNSKKKNLKYLKEELEKLKEEKKDSDIFQSKLISESKIELFRLKERNQKLERDYNVLKEQMENYEKSFNKPKRIKAKKDDYNNVNRIYSTDKYSKAILYGKVVNLYYNCTIILITCKEIREQVKEYTDNLPKLNSKEARLLNMLCTIEDIVNFLLRVYESCKYSPYGIFLLNRVLTIVERRQKAEKAKKQKAAEIEKFRKLQETVAEKSKKVYVYNPRKFNYRPFGVRRKRGEKKKKREGLPGFGEFMYDVFEEDEIGEMSKSV